MISAHPTPRGQVRVGTKIVTGEQLSVGYNVDFNWSRPTCGKNFLIN